MSMHHEPSPHERPAQIKEHMAGLSPKAIVTLVVAACAAVFIVQNTDKGHIEFLFFDWEVGLWFGLLVAFVLGTATGWTLPKLRARANEKAEKAKKRAKRNDDDD